MSLDITLVKNGEVVYDANITHNLNKMASAVSEFFYKAIWRPEEMDMKYAGDVVYELRKGVAVLACAPSHLKKLNPENGWGTYEDLLLFVVRYIEACEQHPTALIEVSR